MGRRTTKKINKRNSGKKPRLMLFLLFIVFILTGILLIIKLWDNEVDSERKLLDEEVSAIMEAEKADITIENDGGYILGPNYMEPTKGIIIYSDTGVDPKAYVPLAIRLAKKGYRVVIPEFLVNGPTLDSKTVDDVINRYESIRFWVVVGHGNGGKVMSNYLDVSDKIRGAVFLASYPDEKADLSDTSLKVVSIYGSLDAELNKSVYEKRKSLLPASTMFVQIENGNYSYFANYENIEGAKITREEQQIQTSVQIFNLLDQIRS